MIDDRTRIDAARAAEMLRGTGKTLLDAAQFLSEHLRRVEGGNHCRMLLQTFSTRRRRREYPNATLTTSAPD